MNNKKKNFCKLTIATILCMAMLAVVLYDIEAPFSAKLYLAKVATAGAILYAIYKLTDGWSIDFPDLFEEK